MEEIKRNRRVILVATVLVLLLLMVIFIDQIDKLYSSEKWLGKPADRWGMTDDIVRSNVLMNKSYSEIVTLLGEPTGMGKPDSSKTVFKTINYFLGTDDISGMDRFLCLELKQDNVVLVYKYFNR